MAGEEKLALAFLEKHPTAAARLLETMETEQAAGVLQAAPAPIAAARCAEQLSVIVIAKLLEELPVLTGAALLRHFAEPVRDDVLRSVNPTRMAALRLLLRYPLGAVGAWMNPSVLTFSSDYSVREAAEMLEQAEHAEPRIYVVDRNRAPFGAVSSLSLLRCARQGQLKSIAEPVETIWARESVAAAQLREIWDAESEAPVVNRQGEFVGSVRFADLRRAQRNLLRSPPIGSSDESLGELAELFLHGLDSAWTGLSDIVRPAQPKQTTETDERGT
jgi:Mg/Co/Ni transporter MgtE